jgi:hypothetical protein
MKTSNQKDTKIHDIISIVALFIISIWIKKTIIITGIQIAIHELIKNLHLITACLRSPLKVNHKFERARLMLLITASHAE